MRERKKDVIRTLRITFFRGSVMSVLYPSVYLYVSSHIFQSFWIRV